MEQTSLRSGAEPAPAGGAEGPARPPLVPRRLMVTLAVVLILAGTGSIVRVPLHSIGPGPARDVLELISIRGTETHPSTGQLLLTTATVSGAPLSIWELVWTWVDPAVATTPRHNVVLPGQSDEERTARNVFDMEESKLLAELAAFSELGIPAARVEGARVISVIERGPAHEILQPKDVILAVGTQQVRSPQDVVDAVRAAGVGRSLPLTIRRDGEQRAVELTTAASESEPDRPVIGVFLGTAYRLPHDVQIDTESIGGPSGGLVFALAIVDVLTPGDLTKGHVIAATGTIEREEGPDGSAVIGPIGAVAEKVRGARAVGASVFMLPAVEAEEAKQLAPDGMIVIGVSTLGDAIRALKALPDPTA